MSRETMHSRSCATIFRHSVVLLREVPICQTLLTRARQRVRVTLYLSHTSTFTIIMTCTVAPIVVRVQVYYFLCCIISFRSSIKDHVWRGTGCLERVAAKCLATPVLNKIDIRTNATTHTSPKKIKSKTQQNKN